MNRTINPIERSGVATRRLHGLGALVLVAAVLGGCTGASVAAGDATSQASRAPSSPGDAKQAAAAIDAFGFDYYKAGLPAGNAVFSPASIVIALLMARAGAVGPTGSEIDKVLHAATGRGLNSLDRALAALSVTIKDRDGKDVSVKLHIANAPFVQSGMDLEQSYLDALASQYGAGLKVVDFKGDAPGACSAINTWASDQTEGRIPQILDKVSPNTRLVLANATYLKAPWQKAFTVAATKNAPFTRADGSRVDVPTMSALFSGASYASGTGWQAAELPYAGRSLAMTIIVPDNLTAFEHTLNAAAFSKITGALKGTEVDLTLPRFKMESKADLGDTLSAMGMPLAFNPQKADFSGIAKEQQLYIARVVHQANISVDEKGTEAAAVTAVVMELGTVPAPGVTLHVDRPFIFAVRDTGTGAILFLGRVADPSA